MKVTIIWPNHNSKQSIEKVFESLRCITKQKYSDYELVIVDDGSKDGSDELIRNFIKEEKLRNKIPELKFIKLSKSYGFTGAVNAGYRARSSDSKYVVIHNNDACMYEDTLREYVNVLEENEHIGALQGIILNAYNPHIVDSAGGYLILRLPSSFLEVVHLRGVKVDLLQAIISKYFDSVGIPITFFEGTMPIIRIEAVRKALGSYGEQSLFITSARFYYLEDIFLSLLLWSTGSKIYLLNKSVGFHYRSLVLRALNKSKEFRQTVERNYFVLRMFIVHGSFPRPCATLLDSLYILRKMIKIIKSMNSNKLYPIINGITLYRDVRKIISSEDINLRKIPLLIRLSLK